MHMFFGYRWPTASSNQNCWQNPVVRLHRAGADVTIFEVRGFSEGLLFRKYLPGVWRGILGQPPSDSYGFWILMEHFRKCLISFISTHILPYC